MHSTKYIYTFVFIMTSGVALLLTGLYMGWKDQSKINESIFNKRAILKSINDYLGDGKDADTIPDEEVLSIFDGRVQQIALNMSGKELEEAEIVASGYKGGKPENIDLAKEKKKEEATRIFPLYIYKSDGNTFYITSVRGSGLWDDIWGNIALKDDMSTIAGASFDHKGETPGLGAEIKDNPVFSRNFKSKKIYSDSGEFTSVKVMKGVAKKGDLHAVDGISGATVTVNGVSEMLNRGLKYYEPYFNKTKGKPLGLK
ncbi:MAG: Na+-transporting NADH:ubiquinone oxidoreductase subunit C [Polaribacter sp.]|jgi:Na+-transporting NADH:ubiquinone oxidoreductase subunit C